jgi:hypothetical protein
VQNEIEMKQNENYRNEMNETYWNKTNFAKMKPNKTVVFILIFYDLDIILMHLSEYKYLLVTLSNSIKPERLFEEFDHVLTGIYVPMATLQWYLITYIYICGR